MKEINVISSANGKGTKKEEENVHGIVLKPRTNINLLRTGLYQRKPFVARTE